MTLRLIVSQSKECKRPPAPPIKRREVEEPRPLSDETKRELIAVHILNTKHWRDC